MHRACYREEMLSLSRVYMDKGSGPGPFKHDIELDQSLQQGGLWDFFSFLPRVFC